MVPVLQIGVGGGVEAFDVLSELAATPTTVTDETRLIVHQQISGRIVGVMASAERTGNYAGKIRRCDNLLAAAVHFGARLWLSSFMRYVYALAKRGEYQALAMFHSACMMKPR